MRAPLSLQTTLTAQKTLIPTTISLTAHIATILAWIAIATSLYTKMKRTPQIIALISSILAFTSAATLIQSGLKPSWGAPIITISGILTILGLTATNVKTTTEKKEEHEDATKQI
jgi:predicted tellurium resistance membrane protein TerC